MLSKTEKVTQSKSDLILNLFLQNLRSLRLLFCGFFQLLYARKCWRLFKRMNVVRNLLKVSFSLYWKNTLTFLNFVLDSWYWTSIGLKAVTKFIHVLKVFLEVAYVQRPLESEPHFLHLEREMEAKCRTAHMSSGGSVMA